MKNLRRYFVAGLLFLIPTTISVWIIIKIFFWLDGILGNLISRRMPMEYRHGIGFFVLILLILLVGILAENFFGKKLLRGVECFLESIPFFNKMYLFIRGIMENVSRKPEKSFTGVVKVKFAGDSYTVGFVTGAFDVIDGKEYLSVFVPTVPNPTTGFYLIYPRESVEFLDIGIEEGLKLVVSAGIFKPNHAARQD